MKLRAFTTLVSAALVISSGVSTAQAASSIPLVTSYAVAATQLDSKLLTKALAKPIKSTALNKSKVFTPEKGVSGEHNYIVRFKDAPLATYQGGISGLQATAPQSQRNLRQTNRSALAKLNTKSAASIAYMNYLDKRQNQMADKMRSKLARDFQIKSRFKAALNGMTVRMTQDEAMKLASLAGIAHIQRDYASELSTDSGPEFIGAPAIWNGSSTGGIDAMGEGIIVGVIDSGINGDHPSFADVGDDGYDHVNPYGSGVYVGECFATASLECNDKLIGRYNFTDAQPGAAADSEDEDGHGSHTASTIAGNVLYDVPVMDADSNASGFTIDSISGVAPHANIIAYRVCAPSCYSSDIVNAVDQAILDGVDVLNHSIGSQPGSPWNDSKTMAFLNARAAGISVANSAGNDGPTAGTAEAASNAPWVAAVAALTHDRAIPLKTLSDFSGGDTTAPSTLEGRAITVGYGPAPIVYAGDYSNGDADPEQCLTSFPAGTWSGGEIVVCDRGSIARVDKCKYVRDGGAAGCVLANIDGGAENLADDPHVIPAIHIDAASGNSLKSWISSGTGHMATIGESGPWGTDPANGDIMGDFSSRGPYTGYDFLAPNIAAPGLAIYAAYVAPQEFEFLQGTSMASPHVAGALALLKQTTSWTDAEILSALMSTATTAVVKEDGVTPADNFDMGAGRVQLENAINAGLLLDESAANFAAADPALGGDPKTLNVASMLDDACLSSCSWERTVEATTATSWTASSSGDMPVTVSPSSFTLAAGETQTIMVTADASALSSGVWSFAEVTLTPADASVATTSLPVVINPSSGIIPESIDIDASRDAGSLLVEGLQSVAFTDLQVATSGLTKTTDVDLMLLGDTDNSDSFDDLTDGVAHVIVSVSDGASRLIAFTKDADSTSPDVDLRVGYDLNGDGLPSADELVCISGTATAEEICDIMNPPAGDWWVQVQNWQASGETEDTITLRTASVDGDMGNMSATGPASAMDLESWDLRVFWNQAMAEGDYYFGTLTLGSDVSNPDNIGVIPVNLYRSADDVSYAVSSNSAEVGDTLTFTITVEPNMTPEDLEYSLSAAIPEGMTVVPGSITGDGVESGGSIVWSLTQPSLANAEGGYVQSTSIEDPSCLMPNFGQPDSGYLDFETFGVFPDSGIVGDSLWFTAFTGQNLTFYGQTKTGISFTDDGFLFFDSTPGSSPWTNTGIPDASDPNDLLAVMWRDFEIVHDSTPGSVRGISLVSAGTDYTWVEYDDVEPWPAGGSDTRFDFEVFLLGYVDDTPGVPEIVFGYDNIVGDVTPATIGLENSTGTAGTQTAFNDATVTDGLLICYDFQGPDFDPVVVSFEVTIDAGSEGLSLESVLTNSNDNPGSEAVDLSEVVEIGGEVTPQYDGWFVGKVVDGSVHRAGSLLPIRFVLTEDEKLTNEPEVIFILRDRATGEIVSLRNARSVKHRVPYRSFINTTGMNPGDYSLTARIIEGPAFSILLTLE